MPTLRPPVHLFGVPLDNITAHEAVDRVFTDLGRGQGGWMFTPNLDILRRLTLDAEYVSLTSGATLRLADGMPLIWASRLKGTPLPERIAGSEIIWGLCERAAAEGRSVYFLGGNPGSAEAAIRVLRERFPALIVAGVECPPLGFERDAAYMAHLESKLVSAAPDLCLVGLPSQKQDPLIRRLLPLLPRTWFAGIGVTFSFVAGEVKKPPVFIRRIGLEWFFRFLQEPRRLAHRYFVQGVPFAIRLFAHAAAARLRGDRRGPSTEAAAQPCSRAP
jgi:N-acetylglucosaminyldiphosphoundecaprenol N-acetyl-beta-D-mannosaminyltransferase